MKPSQRLDVPPVPPQERRGPTVAAILIVDHRIERLHALAARLRAHGHDVATASQAGEAFAHLATHRCGVVIADAQLPGGGGLAMAEEVSATWPSLPVILLADSAGIRDAMTATTRGVFRYIDRPDDPLALLPVIDEALAVALRTGSLGRPSDAWRQEIISHSSLMTTVLDEAALVAASDASVLIRGESGTGKEVLARAIHRASPRASAPFVAINCGAIPEQLLESELFGHVRGAFTGAANAHDGLFQAANGGTVFLDEIGDMPLALQVKLLRVLQERAVRPVGASRAEPIDVRIVSATHRDLEHATAAGIFREDLFYRLNVVSLTLPPLDARREDIPLLANHFLQGLARKYHKRLQGFSPEALQALACAHWPGNVRQLQNVVEQACALATTSLIPLALVERSLRGAGPAVLNYAEAKQRFERNYLIQLLKLTDGNVAEAARLAGRNRTEFYRLLQRHALNPGHFRHSSFVLGQSLG